MQDDSVTYDSFIGFGFNRYAYCMYNPLKYVDPTGERYFGWSGGSAYYFEQQARLVVLKEQYRVYEVAMESHWKFVEHMINSIYTQGDNATGSGSGNHGSGGGIGNNQNGQSGNGQGDGKPTLPSQKKGVPGSSVANPASADYLWIKCHFHYMYGGQATFFVDASTIDFSNISSENLEDNHDGTYSLHLFGMDGIDPQLGAALGEITLTYHGYDLYQIKPDTYNFDIHWNDGWTTRNIITGAAGVLVYGIFDKYQVFPSPSILWGGEFDIIFINKVYIPHNP